jgi:hypothetical protein
LISSGPFVFVSPGGLDFSSTADDAKDFVFEGDSPVLGHLDLEGLQSRNSSPDIGDELFHLAIQDDVLLLL